MPLEIGSIFAGFTVLQKLGSGGMGEVYLARHPRLSRNDALKVLSRDLADNREYRLRFEREADAAAALFHPHIVGVHDRGEFDGQLWISMDYVEGFDSLKLLRDNAGAGLPRSEVFAIAAAVADALDYAHGRGLLHRDVKPANILVTDAQTGRRRIMLADFGVARRMDETSGLTATNMTVGTLSYAAPEQLMGQSIDGRADQYALAATVFQLLTGTAPYADSNPAVVISRRLREAPPRLSDTRPDLADLDWVLERGMAMQPGDRFADCGRFAAALSGSALSPPPTAARPTMAAVPPATSAVPPAPPAVQRSRTDPLLWALAALGVLVVVAVGLGTALLTRNSPPAPATAGIRSPGAWDSSSSRTSPPPTFSTQVSTAEQSRMVLPDADQHGFINYRGARCAATDQAAMILRTTQSAVVICRSPATGLYYRGHRLSDGATIELGDVAAIGGGYRAVNGPEEAFYEVTTRGLVIEQNGQVLADEPAVEAAS